LHRLAAGKSKYAVEHALGVLATHPEETEAILDYVSSVTDFREVEGDITGFLQSPEATLYSYQLYQIFEWLSELQVAPLDRLLGILRRFVFDPGCEPHVRSICMKLLGDFGSTSDLLRLESYYSNARTPLEQCDVICALRRMEVGRRNSFLGRVQADNELTRRAALYVRGRG
jgi:hypothetical protein